MFIQDDAFKFKLCFLDVGLLATQSQLDALVFRVIAYLQNLKDL